MKCFQILYCQIVLCGSLSAYLHTFPSITIVRIYIVKNSLEHFGNYKTLFSVAIALALQCLGCWDRALNKFEQVTFELNQSGVSKCPTNDIIVRGLSFIELNGFMNLMFGGLLVFEYGYDLFNTTFGLYFSTTIVNIYNTKLECIDFVVLFFTSFSIMLVIISTRRLYIFQAEGQGLTNKYARIRQNLEHISINLADKLKRKEEKQLEVLISHFSCPCPVRPWDIFNMNSANFVSVGGLIITYLIVLIQFKLGDSKDTGGFNMTLYDVPKLLVNRTIPELLDLMKSNNNTLL